MARPEPSHSWTYDATTLKTPFLRTMHLAWVLIIFLMSDMIVWDTRHYLNYHVAME